MEHLQAIRSFVEVARCGGFSAAAKSLNLTQSTVSKHVARLEEHLDTQLLVRSSRRIALTDVGIQIRARYEEVLRHLEDAELAAQTGNAGPRAHLRVSLSPVLSRIVLAPVFSDFLTANPDIDLELVLTERHCDVISEGIDVAIRARQLEDSGLVAIQLSPNPMSVVAAPDYLQREGVPLHPAELEHHNCLLFGRSDRRTIWQFENKNERCAATVAGNITCDQGDSLVALAVAGSGIAMMPEWLMREDLEADRLRVLLPDWRPPTLPIHIVYPRAKRVPTKSRRFIDFVRDAVRRRRLLPAIPRSRRAPAPSASRASAAPHAAR